MFILKMILLWWLFLWSMWRVNVFARKYRKDPNYYPPMQRYNWMLKKAKLLLWFYGVKVNVEGYENLGKGPAILAPNHKSNMDPIILILALQKQTKEEAVDHKIPTFLAKIELKKKMTTRNALSLLDTVYIDRKNIRESVNSLKEFGNFVKQNLTYGVVFPEGTRVKEDGLGEFHSGAFKVARDKYLPVIPVAISDTRDALNPKRFKRCNITVKFLSPLKPASILTMDANVVAEKVKNTIEAAL
ncbi:lysophospholipid acyltransferase family protein [Mycoplasmopsis felifaucium]|uniref:lysophospholipid acyltransferase family protein n=1 Tax=Mycoplasmopsis felifaucium TaxID=35768 RepID=UPI0004878F6B|nr:lysophospholipid acyltransferase family protein [Mycoplasmopsis felifaucium]